MFAVQQREKMRFIICPLAKHKKKGRGSEESLPGISVDMTIFLKFCLVLSNSATDSKSSTFVGDAIVSSEGSGMGSKSIAGLVR